MNVYEASIWCMVYHNGVFSYYSCTRTLLIHAMNEKQAKKKIKLVPERVMGTALHEVRATAETIYGLRKTGTVKIKPYYVYSDGRNPRPVRTGAE